MKRRIKPSLRTSITGLLLICSCFIIQGQQLTPESLGFNPYQVNHQTLGEVNFYITSNGLEKSKPVLLYLDGSGAFPLFQMMEQGIGSSVIINFSELSEQYHVVIISKPDVPFIDSLRIDSKTGYPLYDSPEGYTQNLSLDWRVSAAQTALDFIFDNTPIDTTKVVAMGVSEGFQVGAKLASVDSRISHLILMVGNGLNQYFDFIIQNRMDAYAGAITEAESQKNIDSLFKISRSIALEPKNTDKEWYGHSYLRWSSFTKESPAQSILSLDIPIYLIGCSKDRNSSVLGTDYLYLESLNKGKTNITYRVYPYDHSFNEQILDEEGRVVSFQNHGTEVLGEAFEWLGNN